jgi:FMN phosphatase YigB (HAD superfamily)
MALREVQPVSVSNDFTFSTSEREAPRMGPGGLAWIDDVKVALFDLDGTLYQALGLVDEFARAMARMCSRGSEPELRAEVGKVLAGQQTLQMGCFYDVETDSVLFVKDDLSVRAYSWDGVERDGYPPIDIESMTLDDGFPEALTYISNPWNIVAAVSYRFGVDPGSRGEVERSIRKLVGDPTRGVCIPSMLPEILRGFPSGSRTILASNSPPLTVDPCLERLEVAEHFDEVVVRSGKPRGLPGLLRRIQEEYGVEPHEIVTVGDNYWNDIWPAARVGCRTVIVDQFRAAAHRPCDLRVDNLDELGLLLRFR